MGDAAKTVHFGSKVNSRGSVSALCFDPPRRIDLKRETWTISEALVTCPACLEAIKE